jgi:hypothetical protein
MHTNIRFKILLLENKMAINQKRFFQNTLFIQSLKKIGTLLYYTKTIQIPFMYEIRQHTYTHTYLIK